MIVLGIDAAWTLEKPSGLALLRLDPLKTPSVVTVARSYEEFLSGSPDTATDWNAKVSVGQPDIGAILDRAAHIAGDQVDLIAIDMPLSPLPITGRRAADNLVSAAYSAKGAAVHSPSADRPGRIADRWYLDLTDLKYEWLYTLQEAFTGPAFIEVYPHIAIIEMLGLDYRLPYKESKKNKLFKHLPPAKRLPALLEQMDVLRTGLSSRINGVAERLPRASSISWLPGRLKGYEDVLDALVSAWVGSEVIAGRGFAYGDETGAIWGPMPQRLPKG